MPVVRASTAADSEERANAMRRSLYASAAIHAAILLWVALGGTLFHDSPRPEFEVTGVTLVSVDDFIL